MFEAKGSSNGKGGLFVFGPANLEESFVYLLAQPWDGLVYEMEL